MIEDRPLKQEEPGGVWITTFADLMSLLMCFFVLLLSFVELDFIKFKAVVGSMAADLRLRPSSRKFGKKTGTCSSNISFANNRRY